MEIVSILLIIAWVGGIAFVIYKSNQAINRIAEKQETLERSFMKQLDEHKTFLNTTPCNADTIDEYIKRGKELLAMDVPNYYRCQHHWGMMIGRYDYGIIWYKINNGISPDKAKLI